MSSKTVTSEAVAPFPASKQDSLTRISANGLEVLRRRYLRKGVDGKAIETIPEMFWRVASHVALPERAYGDEAAYRALAERFYDLLTELRFFPNSPTFTGAGTPLGQLAACQPYHARVVTEQGLIPIGELVEAQSRDHVVAFSPPDSDEPISAYRVAAAHRGPVEFGRIQATVQNGVKPVIRLTVFGGLHLDVTPDHVVWASPPSKHGRFGWHPASELEEGWLLMVDTRPKPFANAQVAGFDEATAAVVGWLQADGYVGQPQTATSPIIEFETINDDEFDWIQQQIDRSPLADSHRHVREHVVQDETLQYRRIRIYGQAPYELLSAYQLTQRKEKARIPEQVFRSPEPIVASYLRALFQCDGTVERSGFISLASVSQQLLEGVQQLLLQFGICSQIIGYTRRRGGRLPNYKLHIGLYSSRMIFEEKIGFVSHTKRAKLAALNQRGGKQQSPLRAVEIDRIVSLGEMPVYDIQTSSTTYLSAHIAVHNCFVLAIDDDMGKDSAEGIFNTLRNAALIQQTGGGNGFSFSRLRPKSDPVNSSAGVASGPVGFLRVYDAAFGEIAQGGCLLPETLVHTSQGTLRLDELVDAAQPGWQAHRLHVATDEGDRPSPRGYNNGVQPVMAVATAAGLSLTGTFNHKVKVMSAAGPVWRRLDELQKGDAILVMLGQHQGRLRALRRPAQANGLPALLDETLAFVLGYTTGKGQISAESYDGRLRWEVAHDSYLIEALPRLLQGLFPGASLVRHRGKKSSVLVLDSVPVKRFLQANGLLSGIENADAGAPRLVRQSTAEVVGAYLRGLFEALGHVAADGYPQVELASPRLAQEIAALLIGLGAPVQVTQGGAGVAVRIRHHRGLGVWRERIGCDPASRFAACHAYRDPAEAEADYTLPYPEYWLGPVLARLAQPADGPALPEIGSGLLLRRKLQPYLRGETPLTSRAYREFCATSPQFAEYAPPANDLWFVAVQNTQPAGEALTLDLEVEDNHTYLASGLVTHNTRRGANMGVLRVDHPDIEEFIACKAEEGKIANFNISVGVTDAFMRAVEADGDFDLVNPHTKKVSRTVRARDLFDKIIAYAHRNGEPGVLFLDAANRSNPVPHLYELEATNPCGEQYLGPFENCCLGSINLAQHVTPDGRIDWEALRQTTVESTRFLDDVVSANKYVPAVPQLQEAAHRVRRIGLGVMGLADVMYKIGVRYGDRESLDLAGQVMEFVRFHCMKTSIELARERGPFPAITGSIYDPAKLLWQPPAPQEPFSHDFGRPAVDWDEVVAGIKAHGIRNGAQTTIAPTGTIGTVTGCEGYGCEPVFALAYTRYVKEAGGDVSLTYVSPLFLEALDRAGITGERRERIVEQIVVTGTCQGIDELHAELQHTFVVSQDITPTEHVLMQAALQRFVDNSISKCVTGDTLVLTANGLASLSELSEMRLADQFEALQMTVFSPAGRESTDAFYYGGFRETRKVEFEYGFSLEGTPNHRIHVLAEDGQIEFRTLDELKLGDVAVLYSGQRQFGPAGAALPAYTGSYRTNSKRVTFPASMSSDLAFVLGAITSEGAITTNGVSISNSDAELLAQLNELFSALFGLSGAISRDPRSTAHSLQISSRALRNWLLADLGLEAGAEHKIIPACILAASEEEIAAFLRGLLLDGFMTADGKLFGITLASERLIRQLQVLLLNMNVTATMHQTTERAWNLVVQGGELETLSDAISFVEVWKNERMARRNEDRVQRFRNYSRLLPAQVTQSLHALQNVSTHSLRSLYGQETADARQAYQRARVNLLQGHRFERGDAQRIYAHLGQDGDSASGYAARFFAQDKPSHVYVPVRSISAGFAEVFDLSVPGSHSFIANGLGNHNTCNFPPEAAPGDVADAYKMAWELGCKGLTVYVTGSRQEVVLETKATADAKKAAVEPSSAVAPEFEAAPAPEMISTNGHLPAPFSAMDYDAKRPRPRRLHGATYRRLTPLGTAYVTVNDTEEGEPFEVFMNVGKAGSDVAAVSEALGRLISLVLRMPSSLSPTERLQQVVYQLNGIGGGRHLGFGPQRVRSLPDAIAQVLSEHLEQAPAPQPAVAPVPAEQLALPIPKQIGDLCPDCGNSTLLNIEGCVKCHVCGYSEC